MKPINADVLKHIKTLANCSLNFTFSDFPYFLGTKWHYVKGKLQMKGSGKDFMGAWSVGNADWWREYFSHLYRATKHGGYVVFFNIDRQAWAFSSLMVEAGFEPCQNLAWLSIGNFPKAVDAGKQIDKRLKAEREVVGKKKGTQQKGNAFGEYKNSELDITAPATDLAKQFDGYQYGIAPLKKITEPILVFRKEPKNKQVIDDLLAYQHDSTISPAVLNTNESRVSINLNNERRYDLEKEGLNTVRKNQNKANASFGVELLKTKTASGDFIINGGRFPCTAYLSTEAAEVLDSQLDKITFEINNTIFENVPRKKYERIVWEATQNGTLQSLKIWHVEREVIKGDSRNEIKESNGSSQVFGGIKAIGGKAYTDSGYISRVMPKADYTQDDYDSFVNTLNAYESGVFDDTFYMPNVIPSERNAGLNGFEKQ